jgi:thiamine-phosphate pyrophosphorylase
MSGPNQRLETSRFPLVFYVTDRRGFGLDELQARMRLLETIEQAARAGVDAVQIREKDLSGRAMLELAKAAVDRVGGPHVDVTCRTKILVNDRLDVALAAGAAGVHLGGESVAVADVANFRTAGRAPADFLIGRSCHSLEEARRVESEGADYIFFGPVFATPSKLRFGPPQGIAKLADVCRAMRIPVVAIGGITLENAASCISAGAAGVAAIRLFQEAGDLTAVVRGLKQQN